MGISLMPWEADPPRELVNKQQRIRNNRWRPKMEVVNAVIQFVFRPDNPSISHDTGLSHAFHSHHHQTWHALITARQRDIRIIPLRIHYLFDAIGDALRLYRLYRIPKVLMLTPSDTPIDSQSILNRSRNCLLQGLTSNQTKDIPT